MSEDSLEKAFDRFDFSSGGDDSISYNEFIMVVFPPKDMGFQDKDAMEGQGLFDEDGNRTARDDASEPSVPSTHTQTLLSGARTATSARPSTAGLHLPFPARRLPGEVQGVKPISLERAKSSTCGCPCFATSSTRRTRIDSVSFTWTGSRNRSGDSGADFPRQKWQLFFDLPKRKEIPAASL